MSDERAVIANPLSIMATDGKGGLIVTLITALTGVVIALISNWDKVASTVAHFHGREPIPGPAIAAVTPMERTDKSSANLPIVTPTLTASPVVRRNGTFLVNQQCDNAPFAVLKTVKITDSETVLQIRVISPGSNPRPVRMYPPGHKRAFYLTANSNKLYPLTKVEGVAIYPEKTMLAPGETLDIFLHFARLEDSINVFNGVDGDDVRPWVFSNIHLEGR